MRIQLTRRLGQNEAGTVLECGTSNAVWLIQQGHANQLPDLVEQPAVPEPADHEPEAPEEPDEHDTVDELPRNLAGLQGLAASLGVPTYGSKAQLRERIKAAQSDTQA